MFIVSNNIVYEVKIENELLSLFRKKSTKSGKSIDIIGLSDPLFLTKRYCKK